MVVKWVVLLATATPASLVTPLMAIVIDVLNGWPKPAEPFRTRPLDDGNIDVAAALGLLWSRGYTGPIVSQAYDLGGDPYETARRSRDYLREVHARFLRNPALNPSTP